MAAIMNITAVPFGNAEINYATKTVTCQHGELECVVNAYEQCGMFLYPDQATWMPFYVCLESYGSGEGGGGEAMIAAVPECAVAAGMSAALVETCQSDASLVWALQEAAAATTAAAGHTYTPWVVVNNQVMNHEFQFKSLICNAYTGRLPPACLASTKATSEAVETQTRCQVDAEAASS
jgi:interferon gamma-inducible protein 30